MTIARTIVIGAVVFLLVLAVSAGAQAQPRSNIKPVDTLLAARLTYDSALANNSSNQFARVAHLYLRMYRLLGPNSASGLYAHYPTLQYKCAYRRGWCFYRMAELESSPALFDSARIWFERVPRDAQDTVYWWSRIMTAEIIGQRTVADKYAVLDSLGTLPTDQTSAIEGAFDQAQSIYSELLDPLQTPPDSAGERVLLAARLRSLDLTYQRARLKLATGDTAGAAALTRGLDYGTVAAQATTLTGNGSSMAAYADASRLALLRLLSPSDQVAEMHFREVRQSLGSDSLFWDATIRFLREDYKTARRLFGASRGQDENSFWQAFATLLLVNAREFEHARDSFQTFYNRTERIADYNARIASLRRSADHKQLVLQAASLARNDSSLPDEQLRQLTVEDVQFLLRVGATFTNWLDNCLYRLDKFLDSYAHETMDNDAVNFFAGMAKTLEGHRDLDSSTYAEAARILETVGGGKYAKEARYVAALDWVPARNLERSMELLEPLVEQDRSCRALFEIGHLLVLKSGDDHGDCCRAAAVFTYLRDEVFTNNPEYAAFKDAIGGYINYLSNHCGDCIQNVDYDRIDLENYRSVQCPDSLLVDTIGGVPQIVLYESLAKPDQIPLAFRQEFIRMMRVYGMPKQEVYVAAEDRVLEDSRFPERRYEGFYLGIPDEPYIDANWHPQIALVKDDGSELTGAADQCRASVTGKADPPVTTLAELPWVSCGKEQTGETVPVHLIDSGGVIITHDSIQVQKKLEITASPAGFYPTTRRISCPDPRIAPFAFALSHRVNLAPSERDWSGRLRTWPGHTGESTVVQGMDVLAPNPPDGLLEDFKVRPNWRDFAFDRIGRRYLVVDCEMNDGLVAVSGSSVSTLPLSSPMDSAHLLSSPEGIAVDETGNIYVADWGHNRIAIYDNAGVYICEITAAGSAGQTPLLLPTRVAVQVDREGVAVDDARFGVDRVYRDRHIIVADQNGLYRYDSHGNFIEQITAPDSFNPRGFYALGVAGYGSGTSLVIGDPRKGRPVSLSAR